MKFRFELMLNLQNYINRYYLVLDEIIVLWQMFTHDLIISIDYSLNLNQLFVLSYLLMRARSMMPWSMMRRRKSSEEYFQYVSFVFL